MSVPGEKPGPKSDFSRSVSDQEPGLEADWEVTPEGLYIATRHFLVRRGYCCANRCRNCPYINWHANPSWQPAPAAAIQHARVSPKALAGAREQLARHEQELARSYANEQDTSSEEKHKEMIAHYSVLLGKWH